MKLSFGFLFLFPTHTILKQNIANLPLFCAKIYIIKLTPTFFTFLFLFHPSYPIFFPNIPVNQIIKQEAPMSPNRLPDFDLWTPKGILELNMVSKVHVILIKTFIGTYLTNFIKIPKAVLEKNLENQLIRIFKVPWQPCFLTNLQQCNTLSVRPYWEHLCEVWLNSAQWFSKKKMKMSFPIGFQCKLWPRLADILNFWSAPKYQHLLRTL
jgi:hypothetical protein